MLCTVYSISVGLLTAFSLQGQHIIEEYGEPQWSSGWTGPTLESPAAHSWRELSDHLPFYDHGNPTVFEQLMLEYINRARANPGAEAARLGIGLNDNIAPSQSIADTPKQPLAFQPNLIAAARSHSQWMLDNNVFSHTGVNGSNPGDRMESAGYTFSGSWTWGENISWGGSTGPIDPVEETIARHDGLFRSPGHRLNLMNNGFNEMGVGILEGEFTHSNGTTYNALMATQKFARSGATPERFLVGVVYYDFNGNGRYDIGEGISGIEVNVTNAAFYTRTADAGGFAIPVPTGSTTRSVNLSGLGFSHTDSVSFSSDQNHKQDFGLAYQAPTLSGPSQPPAGIPQQYTISNVPGATAFRIELIREADGQIHEETVTVPAGEAFDLTPLAGAHYTLRAQPEHHGMLWPAGSTFQLSTTGTGSSGFSQWASDAEQAAGLTAGTLANHPDADFSGDGISNLLAYALGLSPTTPESSRFPVIQASGSDPFFEYRILTARSDVEVFAEISTNLTEWHREGTANVPSGFQVVAIGTEGDYQSFRVHFPATSSDSHWFLRLVAEQP